MIVNVKKLIKGFIPTSIRGYYYFHVLKKRFPGRKINSNKIYGNVDLGFGTEICKDVIISDGVKIGKYSYINSGSYIASGEIGNYCSIAYNCQIGMYEHPVNYISTSPYIYGGARKSVLDLNLWEEIFNPPIIGNDVWIGSNTIIMQGVKIGDGAIVAAGAVVTKEVHPYTIVGGVPARVIKQRFEDNEIKFLLKLKWWDMPLDEIKKYKNLFESKEKWIDEINKFNL
jgi:acetyltransferase-like isoleucine patch superfamily enzyme